MTDSTAASPAPAGRVAWSRVALFYGISFGMVCLLALGLYVAGANLYAGNARLVFQLTIAFFYMPMPLVAGLIVERVAGRRYLIAKTFTDFRHTWWRILVYAAAAAIGIYVVNMLLVFVLGNVAHVPGVGSLAGTQAQVVANLRAALGGEPLPANAATSLPPVALLYLVGILVALPAGLTINGLFAFGEEYGWRGVLMDELRPLGPVRANILTGVMWGLWHAPIILLGFNYADQRFLGIFMMCVWLVPLSFLLWRSREYSGTVVTPAIIHGAFNASAGFYLLLVTARNPIVTAPVGLIGAASAAIVAGTLWALTRRHLYRGPAFVAITPAAAPTPSTGSAAVEPSLLGATPDELLAEIEPADPEVGTDGTGLGELP